MFLFFFWVPFWCLVFDMFWCCTVLDLVISTYFNHVAGAKCLIYIKLCTESDLFPFLFSCILKKKNSTRLQWYSCARYKAPGPLVQKVVFLWSPSHKWYHKQTKIMFQITKSTLSDRKYSIQCTYIRIEDILWPRQTLWAVKVRAIWWGKEPCSFDS